MRIDDDAGLRRVLDECRTIAVVGLSPRPERPSHGVAAFLQARDYRIVPVTPAAREILGETCYPDLDAVPFKVDMVDVFRQPEEAEAIAAAAVRIGARALWLQLGVISEPAVALAAAAGLDVVMDRCPKIEYARLIGR